MGAADETTTGGTRRSGIEVGRNRRSPWCAETPAALSQRLSAPARTTSATLTRSASRSACPRLDFGTSCLDPHWPHSLFARARRAASDATPAESHSSAASAAYERRWPVGPLGANREATQTPEVSPGFPKQRVGYGEAAVCWLPMNLTRPANPYSNDDGHAMACRSWPKLAEIWPPRSASAIHSTSSPRSSVAYPKNRGDKVAIRADQRS